MALMRFGARQDQRIRRRPEFEIGAVQLETGGPAARQPEIADDLVVYPREDPRRARVVGVRHATIIRALEQPLGGEPNPAKHLRRPAVAPPQPAITAVERM